MPLPPFLHPLNFLEPNNTTLSIALKPPFSKGQTFKSDSLGNIFVYDGEQAVADTGVVSTYLAASKNNPDNRDRAERYNAAFFPFGYINPNTDGNLVVTAEFFLEAAEMKAELVDEFGISGVAVGLTQHVLIYQYKQVASEYVRFGGITKAIQDPIIEQHDGIGDVTYHTQASQGAVQVKAVSANPLTANQRAACFVGIAGGLGIVVDDYEFKVQNSQHLRLDHVSIGIEPT